MAAKPYYQVNFCTWAMKKSSRAFKAGDVQEGRRYYHLAAKAGCRNVLLLDGLGQLPRGRPGRSHQMNPCARRPRQRPVR